MLVRTSETLLHFSYPFLFYPLPSLFSLFFISSSLSLSFSFILYSSLFSPPMSISFPTTTVSYLFFFSFLSLVFFFSFSFSLFFCLGTTLDTFLRENLEWLGKATNWAKFTAVASIGVVHKGHVHESMKLLQPYLPQGGRSSSPYSESGALYALGLIHANKGRFVSHMPLCVCVFVSLSVSLSLSHVYTHFLSFFLSLSLSLSLSRSLTHTFSLSLSDSFFLSLSHYLSFSLSLSLTLSLSIHIYIYMYMYLSFSPSVFLFFSPSHFLSPSHCSSCSCTGGAGDSTAISYLSEALRNSGTNDVVQHGACLGVGLAAMATGDEVSFPINLLLYSFIRYSHG